MLAFQAFHFSPALVSHVTNELKKHVIVVLNKIDLAPPALVVAWKHYLTSRFPAIHVVCFTSFPRDYDNETFADDPEKGGKQGRIGDALATQGMLAEKRPIRVSVRPHFMSVNCTDT